MGAGDGYGEGVGEGKGDGQGRSDEAVVLGGCAAICLIVCFCVVGIPLLLAGSILIALFEGSLKTAGIVCIVIAVLMVVGGVIALILMCTGIIGNKKTGPAPVHNAQVMMISNGQPQPQQYGGPMQPGYVQPGQPSYGHSQEQPPPAYGQAPPGYGQPPPGYQQPGPSATAPPQARAAAPPQDKNLYGAGEAQKHRDTGGGGTGSDE